MSERVYKIGFATLEDFREHDWGQQRDTKGQQSDYHSDEAFYCSSSSEG